MFCPPRFGRIDLQRLAFLNVIFDGLLTKESTANLPPPSGSIYELPLFSEFKGLSRFHSCLDMHESLFATLSGWIHRSELGTNDQDAVNMIRSACSPFISQLFTTELRWGSAFKNDRFLYDLGLYEIMRASLDPVAYKQDWTDDEKRVLRVWDRTDDKNGKLGSRRTFWVLRTWRTDHSGFVNTGSLSIFSGHDDIYASECLFHC